VQLPQHREQRKHLAGQVAPGPPIGASERALHQMLPGAETVEDGTAGKTSFGEVLVDLAAEVAAQVRARPSGRLVDRELR
jgi:hypothetical protein